MNPDHLKSVVEGLIFAGAEPVSVQSLADVIQEAGTEEIRRVLDELEEEYRQRSRGFLLSKVAGAYQFRSLPGIAQWILEMRRMKPARLSKAALETLAIIAYNQPVTRNRIEQIRGVETAGTIRNLVERELAVVVGRKDIPGRPLIYGTSRRFLEVFGLSDLTSLPRLPEIEALSDELEESLSTETE